MYDEDSFKRQILWLKIKRVVIVVLATIIGAAIGVVISSYLIQILNQAESIRKVLISVLTITFFLFALLFTSGIGRTIQDTYWKIALYKKVSIIADKLQNSENK